MIIIIIKKLKKVIWSESKNKPFKRIQLQVNHNWSEIRQLFNPQTDRMGNRRKQEEGWGRLKNFKSNQKYNTNKQVR